VPLVSTGLRENSILPAGAWWALISMADGRIVERRKIGRIVAGSAAVFRHGLFAYDALPRCGLRRIREGITCGFRSPCSGLSDDDLPCMFP